MKRLFALAVAAGIVWACGCKSTTTTTSGGSIDRTPVAAMKPAGANGEIQQTAATESKSGDAVPAVLLTPTAGSDCKH